MNSDISRRVFLAAAMGAVACGKKSRPGFAGYAFVANEEGHAIAAVDMTAFAVARHIALNSAPSQLISVRARQRVYVLTPGNASLHEISRANLKKERSASLGGLPISMRLHPLDGSLWVLLREPRQLLQVNLESMKPERRIALPHEPFDFDLAFEQPQALVSFGSASSAGLASLGDGKLRVIPCGSSIGAVRFRRDGKLWMAAHRDRKLLSMIDTASGRTVVRLPLSMRPDNLCFKSDLGQLFVTGEGSDAVSIVYPYWTQVAETVLAGRTPGSMATSHPGAPELLFVTNPNSNQVTIFNIDSRKVVAVTQVGAEPSHVAITPDNQYALVLNRKSGDMAVIDLYPYISAGRRTRFPAALFTIIPVGSKPVGVVVQSV